MYKRVLEAAQASPKTMGSEMAAGLRVKASTNRCCLQIEVSGELDMATVPDFEQEVALTRATSRPDHGIIDAADLAFVDSSGIKLWVELAGALPEGLAVANASTQIKRVLAIMGTDSILTCYCTLEQAKLQLHRTSG